MVEPADGLMVAAAADDGVVEALQGDDDYPFCLAVQWHPERDPENSVNQLLIRKFLTAAGDKKGKGETRFS